MTPICEKKDRLLWWTRFETPNFFLKTCFRNSWFFLDRSCLNLFEWSCFQNSRWFLDRDNPNYSDALIFDTSNFYLTTMRYHFGLLVFFFVGSISLTILIPIVVSPKIWVLVGLQLVGDIVIGTKTIWEHVIIKLLNYHWDKNRWVDSQES